MKLTKLQILFFILILAAGSFLRLYKLGAVPPSLTDDEIRIAESAYSIGATARDTYGHFLPLSINLDGFAQNPVPIYLTAPFVTILGPGTFSARILTAVLGILDLVLIFYLAGGLTGSVTIGILASAVLSINVWAIQISRFTHEGAFAMFFYLLAMVLILKNSKKNILLVFGCIALILAFYSYHATKLLLPLVALLLILYRLKSTDWKYKFIIFFTVIFAFGSVSFLSRTQNATQYGGAAFFFQDREAASLDVELSRRLSAAPEFIKIIYLNKYAYWVRTFLRHYFYATSVQYLFTDQESNGIYATWNRGQFYLIEAPFMFLGWLYLFKKKRKSWIFVSALALFSPLPSSVGIGDQTYTMRSVMLLPALAIFVAAGIRSIAYFIENKLFLRLIYIFIVTGYLLHLTGYLVYYYYDWSRTGAKYYSYETKQMVDYAATEISLGKKVLVAPAIDNIFLHWAFYRKVNPYLVQKALIKHLLADGNLIMAQNCPPALPAPDSNIVLIVKPGCYPKIKPDQELRDLENNLTWKIYKAE